MRFSSCFPFLGETAFVVPPRSIWPPAARRDAPPGCAGRARASFRCRWWRPCWPGSRCTKTSGPWMARANAWCRRAAGAVPHQCALERGDRPAHRQCASGIPRPASNSAAMPGCGPSCRLPMKRRTRAGPNPCAARCGCWRIPDSAANARAAGDAARSRNSSKARCRIWCCGESPAATAEPDSPDRPLAPRRPLKMLPEPHAAITHALAAFPVHSRRRTTPSIGSAAIIP